MTAVVVTLKIKPEYVEEFKRRFIAVREVIIAERECMRLDLCQSSEDPGRFMIFEVWPSREYFEKVQLAKPYYAPYFEATQHMWNAPRIVEYYDLRIPYPESFSSVRRR